MYDPFVIKIRKTYKTKCRICGITYEKTYKSRKYWCDNICYTEWLRRVKLAGSNKKYDKIENTVYQKYWDRETIN